ncbi:hypothetical protein TNCV_4644371 [Trichonephila clavipes]|nr:hypothetical protein TNCV_4644371 [Trichonephila clavipes]
MVGYAWYWILLLYPSSTHCWYTEQLELHLWVLELVIFPYIQRSPSAIFQQGNAQPHGVRNVQEFFFTHQIELLP